MILSCFLWIPHRYQSKIIKYREAHGIKRHPWGWRKPNISWVIESTSPPPPWASGLISICTVLARSMQCLSLNVQPSQHTILCILHPPTQAPQHFMEGFRHLPSSGWRYKYGRGAGCLPPKKYQVANLTREAWMFSSHLYNQNSWDRTIGIQRKNCVHSGGIQSPFHLIRFLELFLVGNQSPSFL